MKSFSKTISADKIFGRQNFSADKIFDTFQIQKSKIFGIHVRQNLSEKYI